MNEMENVSPAGNSINHLQAECAGLRQQVWVLLVLLVIVSGTLTTYLYRQAAVARKEIDILKPQANQMIQMFTKTGAVIDTWTKQLIAYGSSHPDFQPVLQKYGIIPATPPPAAPKK